MRTQGLHRTEQSPLAEKKTTLNGTYISMEAHNREVKKLKAEIGYEQDRIDCRNTICNANREGMYRKCAELESQIEALAADKDEQAGRLIKCDTVLKQAKTAIDNLMSCNEIIKIAYLK